MSWLPLAMVIFDCDGVLVDSETLCLRALEAEAVRLGAHVATTDLHGLTGLRWADVQPRFSALVGVALPPDWAAVMQGLVTEQMALGVETMPGAAELLRDTASLGLPYRIASNSSPEEMAVKFRVTGLEPLVAGRYLSARDVGVGKPAPDLFLAVARAAGVPPAACLVVEDSRPGVAAVRAAGMRCIGYAPHGPYLDFSPQPDEWVESLAALPGIFAVCMRELVR